MLTAQLSNSGFPIVQPWIDLQRRRVEFSCCRQFEAAAPFAKLGVDALLHEAYGSQGIR